VCFGYRIGEFNVPTLSLPPTKPNTRIFKFGDSRNFRAPQVVAWRTHINGVINPYGDTQDSESRVEGFQKRVAPLVDPIANNILKHELVEEFGHYNMITIIEWSSKGKINKISPIEDLTVDTWLSKTDYTISRKEELKRKEIQYCEFYDEKGKLIKKYIEVACHSKFEPHVEFKFIRNINSRKDEFKVRTGPAFKVMEKDLFKNSEFIKKIPVTERAQFVYDRLYEPDAEYLETDYSSFEALYTPNIIRACELQWYKWYTSSMEQGDEWYKLVEDCFVNNPNYITSRGFNAEVWGSRMSGEMCTSLGNSLTNLMLMKFVAHKSGVDVRGIVEGDDGLFRVIPKEKSTIREEYFAELGMVIKLERYNKLNMTSFCGLTFEFETMQIITDPRRHLPKLFWIDAKYLSSNETTIDELFRAKCMSMMYSFPSCPILRSVADYGLRMTQHITDKQLINRVNKYHRQWEKEWMLKAIVDFQEKGYPKDLRCDNIYNAMEEKFKISVEMQKIVEEIFDSKNDTDPIDIPDIGFHPSFYQMYETYVKEINVKDPNLRFNYI
jgi:hypothetical protein